MRAAAEAGAEGAGASGTLVLPLRGDKPVLSLELGARTLRPWSGDPSRAWIAPEIAFDFTNLRFTITLLTLGTGTSSGRQAAALGIGWGFF